MAKIFMRIFSINAAKPQFKRAYSLIELSIVILIVSILITGALSVSSGNITNAKVKTTNDRMREVYRAMGNFLLVNKRLPCPASLLKVKTVDSDYGTEVGAGSSCAGAGVYQSSTASNLVYGMIPVKSLGLANEMGEDGFESKFSYIIDKNFTKAIESTANFSNPTFGTATSTSIITIVEKPGGVSQTVTADALVAIISYGANKAGAFNSNSSSQNSRSSDADEQSNDATSFNNSPTPKTATFDASLTTSNSNSDAFDDIIFFKRRNDFVNDFNAMFLIPCASAGSSFGNATAYYGGVVYATSSCSLPNTDKRLTKKCEAYGNWVDIVAACP